MADHCSSTFSRYFVPAVIAGTHSVPLHTRVWRDFPLGWLVLEALQEGVAYKKRAPLLALGLEKIVREVLVLGLGFCIYPVSIPLLLLYCMCLSLSFVHKHTLPHLSLELRPLRVVFRVLKLISTSRSCWSSIVEEGLQG